MVISSDFVPSPTNQDTINFAEATATAGTYGSGSDTPLFYTIGGSAFDIETDGPFVPSAEQEFFRRLRGTTTVQIVS